MKKVVQKKRQRGFNLIEAAIVLGVVGLVIGGIWVAAAAVQSNMRESDASKGLIQIVQNVRNLYYGQSPGSTGAITSALVSANAIPGDFLQGSNAVNPWNGAVTVSITTATSTADSVSIAFAAVPLDACIELTSRNTNLSTGIGLSQILIDDGTATATIASTDFPYLPTDAATDCGTTNTITWRFGLRG